MSNIYWERQRGDNCRIHSLNAFFGEHKITDDMFRHHCEEYDSIIWGLKSIHMDGFAECRSIISYIVDKYTNKFCLLVPINLRNIHRQNRELWNYNRFLSFLGIEGGINGFFEFNKGHVWYNIYDKRYNRWYKVDSLSGVNYINKPNNFGENGYILVFENRAVYYEIEYLLDFLKKNWGGDKEIAIYNLFHLLRRIELNYGSDSAYNAKISLMRELKKVLSTFISENRTKKINSNRKDQLLKELHNIINIF